MKVKFSYTIFFAIILTVFLNVSAQERVIEEKEFMGIHAGATENLKGKTYRLIKTEELFSDRRASSQRVNINILEIVQPNKRREVEEIKSQEKNAKTERIWDGKSLFIRENDGDWRKYYGGNSSSGNYVSGRITTIYKFIEKTNLNGQTASIYEVEMNRKANKFTQNSQLEVHYIEKTRFWINEDGNFLKTIKESEIAGSNSLTRETSIYEYNPNIKIETPIIKSEQEVAEKP